METSWEGPLEGTVCAYRAAAITGRNDARAHVSPCFRLFQVFRNTTVCVSISSSSNGRCYMGCMKDEGEC